MEERDQLQEPLVRPEEPHLVRGLGPVEATLLVVGTVIGSGIFLTPAEIGRTAGVYGLGVILLVWVIGGLLSLAGALAFAELGAMFPRSGGQYVFLREAFGPLWAFLYGWMEFWVARSGSIAVLAVAFATGATAFVPLDPTGVRWVAFLAVMVLTLVNYVGVRAGGAVQVVFTAVKVGALGALVVCAFALPGGSAQNWTPVWTDPGSTGSGFWGAVGAAMIAVLWSYDGWTNGAAVSEEVQSPQRTVPRALLGGTALIMAIYLAVNLAYHYVLPLAEVQRSQLVGADVARLLFGDVGGALVSAAVMVSTFGAANGVLLTGPRIFYAMARDGVFFHDLARLHPRFRTPDRAILLQGFWAGVLVLVPFSDLAREYLGWQMRAQLFEQLLTFVVFGSWLFYGMGVSALVVLRLKRPQQERPYRAWGYPVVPFLFVATAAAFVVHTLNHSPRESLAGLGVILLGLPAYAWWRRRATIT